MPPLPDERREGCDMEERARRMAGHPPAAAGGELRFDDSDRRCEEGLALAIAASRPATDRLSRRSGDPVGRQRPVARPRDRARRARRRTVALRRMKAGCARTPPGSGPPRIG
ncbi:hypothetical protein [Streptomyces spiralis]